MKVKLQQRKIRPTFILDGAVLCGSCVNLRIRWTEIIISSVYLNVCLEFSFTTYDND